MKKDKFACTCKNVTYGQIQEAVEAGATTYDEVQKITRFGTGCGKCREFIEYFIRDMVREMEQREMEQGKVK